MSASIFFSWQADTASKEGRNFIISALERALGTLSADAALEQVVRNDLILDRDTLSVAGQPPIVETIFKKIDSAAVFVPDLTFVGSRIDGRPTPNPNVLIEYGWALRGLGYSRIVAVMNVAHGQPGSDMPFDMRHLRHPIKYDLPPNATGEQRSIARAGLARDLERAIRAVLTSDEYRASLPAPATPPPFPAATPLNGQSRFRLFGHPLGVTVPAFADPLDVPLQEGAAAWLRVMPNRAVDRVLASEAATVGRNHQRRSFAKFASNRTVIPASKRRLWCI